MSPVTSSNPAAPSGDPGLRSPKIGAALNGVTETMLITLSARAADAAASPSILNDIWAGRTLDRIDYIRSRTLGDKDIFTTIVLRARLLDAWAVEFLNAAHAEATVLHLGCGLDSRALRLSWGPRVRWVDVDVPDVVELRLKLLPNPEGDYRLLGSSVTDDVWLENVPADRPALVIMEGLLQYLDRSEGERLVRRICDRFPSGQIMFDTVGTWFIPIQALNRTIGTTGAVLRFGLDDGRELEKAHSKLRLRNVMRIWKVPGFEMFAWHMRLFLWICSWLPGFYAVTSYMRHEF